MINTQRPSYCITFDTESCKTMDINNDEERKEPFLVTLRVDSLNYDKIRDRYSITLQDCILKNDDDNNNDNDDNKQNISFEVTDASKIIHIEKGKFISDEAGKILDDDDDTKIDEETKYILSSINNNAMLSKMDKWFFIFWALYIISAIFLFMVIEGDTFVDALYFRIVTSFTVGYGDIVPATAMGKMLNCVFIVVDLAKLAYIDWRIISLLFKYRRQKYRFDKIASSSPHPRLDNEPNLTDTKFAKIVNRNFLVYILILLAIFFITGTLIMCLHENTLWLDAIVWNFVTLSQVGYGDIIPITVAGRIFTVFYIVFGYVLLLTLAVIIFDECMTKMENGINRNHKTKGSGGGGVGGGGDNNDATDSTVELTGLLSQ